MGRPELPLDRDGSPVRELAFWLRDLRNRAGLTYDQLANRTKYSISTLQEAASGRRLPTLKVTIAIVEACEGDEQAWRAYWAQLKRVVDREVPAGIVEAVTPPWAETPAVLVDTDAPETTAQLKLEVPILNPPAAPPARRRQKIRNWLVAGGLLAVVGIILGFLVPGDSTAGAYPFPSPTLHPSAPAIKPATRTYTEQEFNPNGAPTFQFLDASGAGTPVAYGQIVQITCKVYNTTLSSTKPDGYWYRLASLPWDNNYYAVANTFGNGDKMGGPYTHNTDWNVPNC